MTYEYYDITFIITESDVVEGYKIQCIDKSDNEELEGYFSTFEELQSFMITYFDFIEIDFIADMYENIAK